MSAIKFGIIGGLTYVVIMLAIFGAVSLYEKGEPVKQKLPELHEFYDESEGKKCYYNENVIYCFDSLEFNYQ